MIFQQTIIKGKYGTLLSKAAVPFIQCLFKCVLYITQLPEAFLSK